MPCFDSPAGVGWKKSVEVHSSVVLGDVEPILHIVRRRNHDIGCANPLMVPVEVKLREPVLLLLRAALLLRGLPLGAAGSPEVAVSEGR